jgi:arylsulfatase A-like enzyme/Flp pilus assembly protein TadD
MLNRNRRSTASDRLAATTVAMLFAIACGSDEGRESPAAPRAPDRAARARNVVLITLDTTRADALGTYGREPSPSPEIDRLARDGVVFEQALTSSPSTLPSHASIMTGLHPYAHGARSNSGYVLAGANETLAEALRRHGYRTAAEIASSVISKRTRLDQGFESYRDVDSFDVALKRLPVYADNGELEYADVQERDAGDITRFGLRFLAQNKDEPFFLWLHYFDPHRRHAPPNPFRQRFAEDPYAGEIAFTDQQIGRVLRQIDDLGLRDRTFVALTADHGEGLGEHAELSHSFFVYDTTMHVPLILRGPGLPEGRRVASLVRTIDLAPTILDSLGLPPLEAAQGVSLRRLASGDATDLALVGYGESIEFFSTFRTSVLRFLRQGRWKYIHKVRPELYDVRADPGELHDLASTDAERTQALRGALETLLADAPSKLQGRTVDLDQETFDQLAKLGYVGGGAPAELEDELATLDVTGIDPRKQVEDISVYADAWRDAQVGKHDVAVEKFEGLRSRYPGSPTLLYALGNALREGDRHAEAVPVLERALEVDPSYEGLYIQLADSAQEVGRNDVAERALRAALARNPCSSRPRIELSVLLRSVDRRREQLALLREGVEQCPDSADFQNDYAYALATTRDADLRDGDKALEISRRIVDETASAHPAYLDTLASAYAEVGDFGNAVATSRKALALLESRDVEPEVVETFRANLASFEAGKPARE